MSEQLWFTWTSLGLKGGNGFQIRAVSPGLQGASGRVDLNSERIRALTSYVEDYHLPSDVQDAYMVTPEEAPRSLVFTTIGQEKVLIHKAYTGRDGVGRAGAFFSHLLTDLPPVPLPGNAGTTAFSAREAIQLWQSPFWKTSERALDPASHQLPRVFIEGQNRVRGAPEMERAYAGTLSATELIQLKPEHLHFVLMAWLTMREGQRLYIAAPPERVASLIWGLTHALPRTIRSMQRLTFSTYEALPDMQGQHTYAASPYSRQATMLPLPAIVGACWLYIPQDFPPSYYQTNTSDSFALNCYTNRYTKFATSEEIQRYTSFAVDCLLNRNGYQLEDLQRLVDEAEERGVQEFDEFFRLYIASQAKLSPAELVTHLEALAQRFREQKVAQSDIEILQRPNVQGSLLRAMEDQNWWRREGSRLLADIYTSSGYSILRPAYNNVIVPLAEMIATELYNGVRRNNVEAIRLWNARLTDFTRLGVPSTIWLSFIQQLTVDDLFISAFRYWWEKGGRSICSELCRQPGVPVRYRKLSHGVAEQLAWSLCDPQHTDKSYCHEILSTIAPATHEPLPWIDVFVQAKDHLYTSQFRAWWKEEGCHIAASIREYVEHNDTALPGLEEYVDQIVQEIKLLVDARKNASNFETSFLFLLDILATITPRQKQAALWTARPGGLLHNLSQGTDMPYKRYPSWPVRRQLLGIWASIPSLQTSLTLNNWLYVRWSEMKECLSLPLPISWRQRILENALTIDPDDHFEAERLFEAYQPDFEKALAKLIKEGQSEKALNCIRWLSQYLAGPKKGQLLAKLLEPALQMPGCAEQLLQLLPLKENEIALFVGECDVDVWKRPDLLPPVLLSYLESYLKTFDFEQVRQNRAILEALANLKAYLSPEAKIYLTGWYHFHMLLAGRQNCRQWLYDEAHFVRQLGVLLPPERKERLREELLSRLLPQCLGPEELPLLLANLGPVFESTDQTDGWAASRRALLEHIAQTIIKMHLMSQIEWCTLLPYITAVLGHAHDMPSKGKTSFVSSCLDELLPVLGGDAYSKLNAQAKTYWSEAIEGEWNRYKKYNLDKIYSSLREAVMDGDTQTMFELHKTIKELDPNWQRKTSFSERELEAIHLSHHLYIAYESGDDEELHQVYRELYAIYGSNGSVASHINERIQQLQLQARKKKQQGNSRKMKAVHSSDQPASKGNARHGSDTKQSNRNGLIGLDLSSLVPRKLRKK